MNKKHVGIVVVVVLAVAVILVLIKKTGTDTLVVESDDGSAVLEIPQNGLPEGFDREKIQLEKLSEEDIADMFIEGLAAGYRLLPDGLVLTEPAVLRSRLPVTDTANVVTAFHYSETNNMFEYVPVKASIDMEKMETIVESEVNHFSSRYFGYGGASALLYTSFGILHAGDEFAATARVTIDTDYRYFADVGHGSYWNIFQPEWGLEGWFEVRPDSRDIISPDMIVERPPVTGGIMNEKFSVTGDFMCETVGRGMLHYHFITRRTKNVQYLADSVPGVLHSWITLDEENVPVQSEYDISESVECRQPFSVTMDDVSGVENVGSENADTNPRANIEVPDRAMQTWVKIGAVYVPEDQFTLGNVSEPETEHRCVDEGGAYAIHYHARTGNQVVGTLRLFEDPEFVTLTEPEGPCGFGFYDEIERIRSEGPIIQ